MAQLVTRIDEDLAAELDALVAAGVVESRSDGVRRGLRALVDLHRRARVAQAIVAGYQARPQTDSEFAGVDDLTARMIADEPW